MVREGAPLAPVARNGAGWNLNVALTLQNKSRPAQRTAVKLTTGLGYVRFPQMLNGGTIAPAKFPFPLPNCGGTLGEVLRGLMLFSAPLCVPLGEHDQRLCWSQAF